MALDRYTLGRISGWEVVRQQIEDVLGTPLGTRVGRREYGSLLPYLVDAPWNAATQLDVYVSVATALGRWVSDFALDRVSIAGEVAAGQLMLSIEGRWLPGGEAITLDGLSIASAVAGG